MFESACCFGMFAVSLAQACDDNPAASMTMLLGPRSESTLVKSRTMSAWFRFAFFKCLRAKSRSCFVFNKYLRCFRIISWGASRPDRPDRVHCNRGASANSVDSIDSIIALPKQLPEVLGRQRLVCFIRSCLLGLYLLEPVLPTSSSRSCVLARAWVKKVC